MHPDSIIPPELPQLESARTCEVLGAFTWQEGARRRSTMVLRGAIDGVWTAKRLWRFPDRAGALTVRLANPHHITSGTHMHTHTHPFIRVEHDFPARDAVVRKRRLPPTTRNYIDVGRSNGSMQHGQANRHSSLALAPFAGATPVRGISQYAKTPP
jgi:hypothetical protein